MAKMFLLEVGDMWPRTFIIFYLQVIAFYYAQGLILSANSVSLFREGFAFRLYCT